MELDELAVAEIKGENETLAGNVKKRLADIHDIVEGGTLSKGNNVGNVNSDVLGDWGRGD